VAIQLAYDPTAERITTTYPTGVVAESFDSVRIRVPMGEKQTPTWADAVWVATPELLRAWKLDPGLARSEAELLGPPRPDLHLGISKDVSPALVESTEFDFPAHRSAAPYWIPQRAVVEGGLATVTAGWVLESPSPITADQRTELREANAGSFWIDLPDPSGSEDLHSIRLVASLIAYAAGLAVLAMTVGLVRSEAQDADRTLTAVGAPARTQRWIAGATAGLLSFAGSILAVPIGLLFLVAMTSNPSGKNTFTVPWRNLTVIPVGLPLIATIGAFLLTSTRSSYERRPHR
jgi:putative ABC transport system permease protein